MSNESLLDDMLNVDKMLEMSRVSSAALIRHEWVSDVQMVVGTGNSSLLSSTAPFWRSPIVYIGLLSIHAISFFLNLLLLTLLCQQHSRKTSKLKLLISVTCCAHALFDMAWIIVILLVDVVDIQQFEGNDVDREVNWMIVLSLLGRELLDRLLSVLCVLYCAVAMDRYLCLFQSYPAYTSSSCERRLVLICPPLMGACLFDRRLLQWAMDERNAVFASMCLLLLPSLAALLFLFVASVRKPRADASSLTRSLPFTLFLVCVLDVVARGGLFFQLLELDLRFVLVTGTEDGDAVLDEVMRGWQMLSHLLLHCLPLLWSSSLLCAVRHYRHLLAQKLCCCTKSKVDYSSETMRSILADQTARRRIYVSSKH